MTNKLYIEFRVEVPHNTNQDLLKEVAEQAKDILWDEFDGISENSGPIPQAINITYELRMEVSK